MFRCAVTDVKVWIWMSGLLGALFWGGGGERTCPVMVGGGGQGATPVQEKTLRPRAPASSSQHASLLYRPLSVTRRTSISCTPFTPRRPLGGGGGGGGVLLAWSPFHPPPPHGFCDSCDINSALTSGL
ncbi:hypothetical protein FQA47_005564 [Oryzias melastigma]|uniref:Secreted protein n=1 Tax=Oryzias melastigma TaxID=30732 RepID=A0A834CDC4_ORYME|nr:hypothetical protein FQA47_005564 [Oryzias melastigma]